MGLFGKSLEEKVEEALEEIRGMKLGVRGLTATVDDKIVTLIGAADTKDVKNKVMVTFNELVETDNTINTIALPPPKPEPAPLPEAAPAVVEAPAGEQTYEVVSGDTLGGIAKKFYGSAGKYMKIFEANTDILDNPNMIKVGQKLRIPE